MTTDTTSHPKHPSHTVYFLKDKEGLNLSLTVLGQQISLVVRKNKSKEV